MEGFISQFIQEAVDHVDPHTQLLPAQAQDKALIDVDHVQTLSLHLYNVCT